MASIVLRKFNGMAPSANAKAVPEEIATYAQNVHLRFGDFRPMPVAENITAATAGNTLYRFEADATFITKTGEVSFVRGPIPTDATERTYYTGDGVPKVTNLSGEIRQLGVPQPTIAPACTVVTVDEYSQADAASAQAASLSEMTGIIRANMVWTYTGIPDAELGTEFTATPRPWEFSFTMAGTMVGGAFVPTNTPHYNLLDPRFSFYLETDGAGVTVAKVPCTLRGNVLSFDASLEADLDALVSPADATQKLLTAEQRTAIASAVNNTLESANQLRDTTIENLRTLKAEFIALANSTDSLTQSDRAAVQDFYARSEVTTIIASAKRQAAYAIKDAVNTFNTSNWGGG